MNLIVRLQTGKLGHVLSLQQPPGAEHLKYYLMN